MMTSCVCVDSRPLRRGPRQRRRLPSWRRTLRTRRRSRTTCSCSWLSKTRRWRRTGRA